MFVGHLAVGFGAKRLAPRASLAVLLVGAQFADLLWPPLVALGIEQVRIDPGNTAFTPLDFVSYPYSHSLLWLLIWGVALGGVCWRVVGNLRTGVVVAALVPSHWVLDFVTHRPDMPLYPGGPKVGLELWRSIPGTLAVEIVMYATGLWLYFRATEARDWIGRWVSGALALFLALAYLAAIGSVPPSVPGLYLPAMAAGVLLTLWSWWADTHRAPHRHT